MLGSSWAAAQLAASQEGLSSMSEWCKFSKTFEVAKTVNTKIMKIVVFLNITPSILIDRYELLFYRQNGGSNRKNFPVLN
jgi:hypothetical protein